VTEIHTRTLTADHLTPVRAYYALRHYNAGMPSFLFESVERDERWGRYSILGYRAPTENVTRGGDVIADAMAGLEPSPEAASLAERFARGRVGFIAYDAVNQYHDVEAWPDCPHIGRFISNGTIVVFDNQKHTMTLAGPTKESLDRCEWEMRHGPHCFPMPVPERDAEPLQWRASMSDAAYKAKVERAKEYIAAGDVFQVVLARTFKGSLRGADPFDVYRSLRALSPAPYLYFLEFPKTQYTADLAIVGASPETLVRVEDREVTVRPLAGTRKRGANEGEDRANAEALSSDPKERAEHVMLIDLARNDVGKVSEPGSVHLTRNMEIERFSHVMHLVSEVRGTRRSDTSIADAVRAAFPAGTLTGAPKVRATQIIRELEPASRYVYGGAVGYFTADSADLAIAIRTIVCSDGNFEIGAGAGIVADSDPDAEAEETRAKARAGFAAVRAAQDHVEPKKALIENEERSQARLAARKAELAAAEAAAKAGESS
jgi:anthranilate synthase component 1